MYTGKYTLCQNTNQVIIVVFIDQTELQLLLLLCTFAITKKCLCQQLIQSRWLVILTLPSSASIWNSGFRLDWMTMSDSVPDSQPRLGASEERAMRYQGAGPGHLFSIIWSRLDWTAMNKSLPLPLSDDLLSLLSCLQSGWYLIRA